MSNAWRGRIAKEYRPHNKTFYLDEFVKNWDLIEKKFTNQGYDIADIDIHITDESYDTDGNIYKIEFYVNYLYILKQLIMGNLYIQDFLTNFNIYNNTMYITLNFK